MLKIFLEIAKNCENPPKSSVTAKYWNAKVISFHYFVVIYNQSNTKIKNFEKFLLAKMKRTKNQGQ